MAVIFPNNVLQAFLRYHEVNAYRRRFAIKAAARISDIIRQPSGCLMSQ
jgi:hypothetical protein